MHPRDLATDQLERRGNLHAAGSCVDPSGRVLCTPMNTGIRDPEGEASMLLKN